MIKLRRFLKGYKKEVIIGPLCKLFEAILELFVPLVMANIIDVGINELHDTGYVLRMGGVLILLAATGLTSALFCQYFASKASQGAGTEIRRALFRHINSLSHAELDRLGTPSLITRITNDTNQVQQNIAMCIRLLTRAPFIIIGSLIMAMSINLRMSLIFFGAALLIALTLYIVMSRSVPLYAAVQKKLDKIGLISRENLSGNRVIRAFSKQNTEKARVDAATEDLTRTSVRVSKLSALLSPITYLVTDCAIIAIVWFGAVNVNAGGMKTGDIVALVSYMTQILLAMVVVANLVILMTKAGASAKRINEVFETKPSVAEINHDYISAKENTPKIEFRNVRFNYSSDGDDELSGISFTVKNGQTVGIIGGTGSGKSTLISLIPRFYDTSDGAVLVDGNDVRDYPFEQLRKKFGIVPQQSVLFSGTIRDNMKWQNPDASDEEIKRALQIAQAAEFVDKLPNGLDSRVEQGGKNFSGGQRQRLCIARAIVSQPEILILDDSFSALDFATDAALRKGLAENAKGATVLIVTQRCSTIKNADLILVLSDGRLAGQGRHEELFERCEVYRDICLSQLSETEVAK
ncbi:MAG: ABC transporter ATP-binding protein [Ruminococcus sp.]|nr:ABC transporter ATP-binding protein [Ruminococcus sp.]MBQ1921135.1 ABC transporter ATP-binding protein [Ruminococcus sp.]MBQ4172557.1 ABC transporter ATP-binding protein [Ruminococcus sp.]MBQ4251268.1 ABC transporter ATP-binding protein [Ruminococcus sp.]